MTLAEFVQKYRFDNGLSQRRFAARCGISNSTVSQIESGLNNNGVPISFQLSTYASIAQGLGIPMDDFLMMAGDDLPYRDRYLEHPTSEAPAPSISLTEDETTLLSLFRSMDPEGRSLLLSTASAFAATHPIKSVEKEA